MSKQLEHDYIGLTEVSTMENCFGSLKTELSLGLPGCESPERKSVCGVTIFGKDFEGKCQNVGGGCYSIGSLKRGFSDVIENWGFSVLGKSDINNNNNNNNLSKNCLEINNNINNSQKLGVSSSSTGVQEKQQPQISAVNENGGNAPSAKAQVVGWPPIRSFRKNTLASTAKNNEQAEEKSSGGCLYVKVSMDGAPYLRKVDLQTYRNYMELSSALEKMFSCFIAGQYGTKAKGHGKQDGLGENQSADLQNAEFVLTYEDKDGDWMLVGDVPWRMFTENCRKLRVMKGSEAIGLAPDAAEKRQTEA